MLRATASSCKRLPLRTSTTAVNSIPSLRSARNNDVQAPKSVAINLHRSYNFASDSYAQCIHDSDVTPDLPHLREATLKYLSEFDKKDWYDDPICTILKGKSLKDGKLSQTTDAFGRENGNQILATENEVQEVIDHLESLKTQIKNGKMEKDFRKQVRKLEQELLGPLAPQLVGNQAMDFFKQDGITEIEESIQANTVERKLNDLLFEDELNGKITIDRSPAFCLCVSNFTNFLDLFRKTIRNLELGVPVVVFSRSNTTQHMFRWAQLLSDLLSKEKVPPGMLTFLSSDISYQRVIMSQNPSSASYFTGSRPVAKMIKEVSPKLMASTGGPNTMVTTYLSENIKKAVRLSASIENSGQCTALRHLIAPCETTEVATQELKAMFENMPSIDNSSQALSKGEFAGVFNASELQVENGYEKHPHVDMAYRVNNDLPETDLDEHWRNVYVDLTRVEADKISNPMFHEDLASWLVDAQPISLAVNARTNFEAYPIAKNLFEKTSMVVCTVGCEEFPALTAQARPQDGEVFGEFPPRRQFNEFTKFPVVVPTSTPGYNSRYQSAYLHKMSSNTNASNRSEEINEIVDCFAQNTDDKNCLGYVNILVDYLIESSGPRRGKGGRTSLWGLQRPPMTSHITELRVQANTPVGDVACYLVPFLITNARTGVQVSVDPENQEVISTLEALNKKKNYVRVIQEKTSAFETRVKRTSPWNVINPTPMEFDMVGHFVSTFFPLGHIKSTKPNDEAFVEYFTESAKWLRV